MYLWRRQANPGWWLENEVVLRGRAGDRLAIIERPNRKRLQIEVACQSRRDAAKLVKEFGGHVQKLGRDWLERFAREQKSEPLKIGKRLIINVGGPSVSRRSLIVPHGAAFGTGDHATTAMSLRLLEQLTRKWAPGWTLVDLGTGSGILALAARRFGARRVLAIDNDATAISTAKANARLNKIDNIAFRIGDVRRSKFPHRIDIVTANLFSELLIEVVPRLKTSRWLILSGILRTQERQFTRALRRNKIDIVEVRRRGKWIALLAKII